MTNIFGDRQTEIGSGVSAIGASRLLFWDTKIQTVHNALCVDVSLSAIVATL